MPPLYQSVLVVGKPFFYSADVLLAQEAYRCTRNISSLLSVHVVFYNAVVESFWAYFIKNGADSIASHNQLCVTD